MKTATTILILTVCALTMGCAGQKAVDSTAAIRALTAGESHITYSMIPGDLVGNAAFAGKVIAIPTIPGKDVEFNAFYADGTPFMVLKTKRSAVTDAILGQIAGIDAQKFAEDAAQREFYSAQIDKLLAIVQPFLQQALVNYQAGGGPTTTMRQRATDWLELASDPRFAQLVQLIRNQGVPPTSQPVSP